MSNATIIFLLTICIVILVCIIVYQQFVFLAGEERGSPGMGRGV